LLWWWRGRTLGKSEYLSEFWLVDPYRPELGQVGLPGLLARVVENVQAYAISIVPEGITGLRGPALPVLGIGLVLLALVGWVRSVRKERSVAEIFFPLYACLILLWPPAWSGDRFALPLIPLLICYGGVALAWGLGSWRRGIRAGGLVLAGSVFLAPALLSWKGQAVEAARCAEIVRAGSPFGCYGSSVRDYATLAGWSGANLPDEAVVITRKPRIFFLLSGRKTQSIPLVIGWEEFGPMLPAGGDVYLTLDRLGGLTGRYMIPILRERPTAFCWIAPAGGSGDGAQLFGVMAGEGSPSEGDETGIAPCPADRVLSRPRPWFEGEPGDIPLLSALERDS
jgi:hypothetical protein